MSMPTSRLEHVLWYGNECTLSSHIARVNDIQLMPQLSESCFIKGLHEDVGELIIYTYIR
jgi:hypothetical protein